MDNLQFARAESEREKSLYNGYMSMYPDNVYTVKITATYEKIIEIPYSSDFDEFLENAYDNIELTDLIYDFDIIR